MDVLRETGRTLASKGVDGLLVDGKLAGEELQAALQQVTAPRVLSRNNKFAPRAKKVLLFEH